MNNTTPDWLKDAWYEYNTSLKLLIVHVPNSFSSKVVVFTGEEQYYLVSSLLDGLYKDIHYEVKAN